MIAVLGDIHFRDDHPYFMKVVERFLEWYFNWELNSPENDLILAGDLVENSILSGQVVNYLERFIKGSRFKSVNICVGNHDKKKYRNQDQLAFEFFKNKENVFVYEDPAEVVIGGIKVLMLPYYTGLNSKNLSMSDYYSSIHDNRDFSNDYDLVVGHFTDDSMQFFGADSVRNLELINTKKIILGHIHTPVSNPERYIGSVFACRKSENDRSRAAFVYDNGVWEKKPLPLFNEFLSVVYPGKLPVTEALEPIYTIYNCKSEDLAYSEYGRGINIKKVTTDISESYKMNDAIDRQFNSIKEFDLVDIFDSFVDDMRFQGTVYDNRVIEYCKSLLKEQTVTA